MPDFARPAGYLDKLLFVQRTVKAATFRNDKNQALRELCEAMTELVVALIEREQGRDLRPGVTGQPQQKPAP
jgi:hypothetical protein